GFDHGSTEDFVGADAAVVTALGGGEAVVGPAEGLDAVEQRVFLLESEPGVVPGVAFGHLAARRARVARMWFAADQLDLTQYEAIGLAAAGVGAGEHWPEDAVGAIAGGLLSARAVEAPDWRLLAARDDLGLGTQ